MFSDKSSSSPPSYTSYTSNTNNSRSNVIKYTTYSHKYETNQYSSNYNMRSPRYHGPEVNQECNILRIMTETYDTKTGKITNKVDYINKNNIDSFSYPRNEVYVSGLKPIPNYLLCNSKERDTFFKEQKRLLLNKQLDERLRLEAQKVYPFISFNN